MQLLLYTIPYILRIPLQNKGCITCVENHWYFGGVASPHSCGWTRLSYGYSCTSLQVMIWCLWLNTCQSSGARGDGAGTTERLVFDNNTDRGTRLSEELDTVWWLVCGSLTVSHVITSPSITCQTEVWETRCAVRHEQAKGVIRTGKVHLWFLVFSFFVCCCW